MKKTISDYILCNKLLDKKDKHIVALSGGADSVALLLLLIELGYNIEAAHCNFHLRGEESDRDEIFVKHLCAKRGIALHLAHFNTREYAALHKVSIEMAARTLRYTWFEQLRSDIDAASICVAHHRDDSVETFLINLLRGTGIHGLTGIRPVNGRVVRPLLCVTRSQIEEYLKEMVQDYVTDSTNLVDDVMRNKIRLNVLPSMMEAVPGAAEAIGKTADRLSEAAKLFDCAVKQSVKDVKTITKRGVSIDLQTLFKQPSPEYILFEILKEYGFSPSQTEKIFGCLPECHSENQSGKIFVAAEYDLLVDRGRLLIEPRYEPIAPFLIQETGLYVIGNERWRVETKQIDTATFRISKSKECATLDADKVRFPLTVRPVREGERFTPFGMKGTKLVSDYLTDRKRTLFDKRRQTVVVDADGNIVWLVKERPGNNYCIDENTSTVLLLSIGSYGD